MTHPHRDCVKMTPDRIATVRALAMHWTQVEIAAWLGCAASSVSAIQRDLNMPRMSASGVQFRNNALWRRMWGDVKHRKRRA